jgi:hypothetical protein
MTIRAAPETLISSVPRSAISWRKIILLNHSALSMAWDRMFPKHDFGTGRLARYPLDSFERACDRAEAKTSKQPVNPATLRAQRMLAEDYLLDRTQRELNERQNWPTPQVTVEAIWHSIRERGLDALNEPVNKARLQSCDAAARSELERRIEKLRASASPTAEVVL